MNDGDILLTTAEVATAFAGFAGVATVFAQRRSIDDPRINQFRLRSIIENGLLTVAFSFLPFLPERFGASEAAAWRISSAVFAPCFAAIWVPAALRIVRFTREGIMRRSPAFTVAVLGAAVVGTLAPTVNAFGLAPQWASGLYLVGLFSPLLLSGLVFVRLFLSFQPSVD